MVAPPYLLSSLKALQMHSHRFVPQSIQAVMTDFMSQNLIYKHIRNAIDEASDRKALFLSLFEKLFDEGLKVRSQPTSSFHVVAELKGANPDQPLVSALKNKGIITHPLSKCYIGEPQKQGLILGYSCINRGLLAQYMPKMAGVYFGR
jgi:GntR family transcriptional regulator/MocR family aminotransferase